MKQPCEKNCPERKAGCAITCPKWAKYVKERDKNYEERHRKKEQEYASEMIRKKEKRRR